MWTTTVGIWSSFDVPVLSHVTIYYVHAYIYVCIYIYIYIYIYIHTVTYLHIYYIGVARQTVLLILQFANYLRHRWNT